jgi:hypothetical protein
LFLQTRQSTASKTKLRGGMSLLLFTPIQINERLTELRRNFRA